MYKEIKYSSKYLHTNIVRECFQDNTYNFVDKQHKKIQLRKWQNTGCPVPPPDIVKQNTIQEYQKKYGYTTFIETGTYQGDMVEAQKTKFEKIISIELGVELSKKAQKRFKNDKNITILQGDSGKNPFRDR